MTLKQRIAVYGVTLAARCLLEHGPERWAIVREIMRERYPLREVAGGVALLAIFKRMGPWGH